MTPATQLLCDLIRLDQGKLTMNEIRQNWTANKYPTAGALRDWALWCIEKAK